jgi:hypothetical protein
MYRVDVARKRVATARRRRRDHAAFAVIGALLALYFLIEFGWVIARQSI